MSRAYTGSSMAYMEYHGRTGDGRGLQWHTVDVYLGTQGMTGYTGVLYRGTQGLCRG